MAASRTRLWDALSSADCSAPRRQRLFLFRLSLRCFTKPPKYPLSRSTIMTRNDPNQLHTESSTPRSVGVATRWSIIFGMIIVLSVAYAVFEGMQSRVQAKVRLHQAAVNSAMPFVNVVYPISGAEAGEIELPGNTQA